MMASDRTAQAYSQLLKMRTLDLIERLTVWSQITAVACALWELGELTGPRFQAICREIEQGTSRSPSS